MRGEMMLQLQGKSAGLVCRAGILMMVVFCLAACGGKDEGVRVKKSLVPKSSDAVVATRLFDFTNVWFNLPDRRAIEGDFSVISSQLNGYQVVLESSETCNEEKSIELSGRYVDEKKVSLLLEPSCTYWLSVALGNFYQEQMEEASFLAVGDMAHRENFEAEVFPIFEESCLSCHGASSKDGDLSTFETSIALMAKIKEHLEMETMPPSGPLQADKRAVLDAWLSEPLKDPVPDTQKQQDEGGEADEKESVDEGSASEPEAGGDIDSEGTGNAGGKRVLEERVTLFSFQNGKLTPEHLSQKESLGVSLIFKAHPEAKDIGITEESLSSDSSLQGPESH